MTRPGEFNPPRTVEKRPILVPIPRSRRQRHSRSSPKDGQRFYDERCNARDRERSEPTSSVSNSKKIGQRAFYYWPDLLSCSRSLSLQCSRHPTPAERTPRE